MEDCPEGEFLFSRVTAQHFTVDGQITTGDMVTNIENIDRRREILAEGYGVDPEAISIGDEARHCRAGRLSVGFRKWRSSWDPRAENNPDLN